MFWICWPDILSSWAVSCYVKHVPNRRCFHNWVGGSIFLMSKTLFLHVHSTAIVWGSCRYQMMDFRIPRAVRENGHAPERPQKYVSASFWTPILFWEDFVVQELFFFCPKILDALFIRYLLGLRRSLSSAACDVIDVWSIWVRSFSFVVLSVTTLSVLISIAGDPYILYRDLAYCRDPEWRDICSFRVAPQKKFSHLQLHDLQDDFIQEQIQKPAERSSCSVSLCFKTFPQVSFLQSLGKMPRSDGGKRSQTECSHSWQPKNFNSSDNSWSWIVSLRPPKVS